MLPLAVNVELGQDLVDRRGGDQEATQSFQEYKLEITIIPPCQN